MKQNELKDFASSLMEINKTVGMKMSARGWAYALEGMEVKGIGIATKADFDLLENLVNKCRKFYIPIATSKGWSSIIQRAEYAKRFKEAENDGLICVLLYCGDHDPDGLRISEFLRKNLKDLKNIFWEDGTDGYDPENLIIHRFGLNYDFIVSNNLTWIENLITGSKGNLASPSHKNYHMSYVQEYLKNYGERKCEANAIVKQPEKGRTLCYDTIIKYLGSDAQDRFKAKMDIIEDQIKKFKKDTGLDIALKNALDLINKEDEEA